MDVADQRFREFLRQRGLKYTSERVAILKVVQRFGRPFEAEELMLELREAGGGAGEGRGKEGSGGGRISKSTVYRTLKHLLDAGLIKQVYFGMGGGGAAGGGRGGGKQAHYDFVAPGAEGAGGGAHDYLMDLETGKIIPFSSELVVKVREEIARKMGFVAVSHRFQIIGKQEKK